jgi:hypothetical protein
MSKVIKKTSPVRSNPVTKPVAAEPVATKKVTKKPAGAKPKAPAEGKKRKAATGSKAPKRPLTAFIMYMSDNRDRIKSQNPESTFGGLSKIGAVEWKSVKPNIREKYEAAALRDKERYAKEMETYVPDPADKKKRKIHKDPDAPKKPKSAYIFFVNSRLDKVRKTHPDWKMTEVMTSMGTEWKALSDKDKKPFNDLAAKDKKRYLDEKV